MNGKRISFSVYALVWLVLIVLQTLTTSLQGTQETSVFHNPKLYYSTWLTDLYLIALFYLNYAVLAPRLMRQRLFRAYLWIVVVAALIGLLIPLLCYSIWELGMPGFAPGVAPVSSLGVVGAVAIEWNNLNQEVLELRKSEATLQAERDLLRSKLEGVQHTQLQAAASAVASPVTEKTID